MSRILLVDDSPHAQRMGERILSEEGYEVVTVSNADSALIRLDDVDPDVVIADTVMPGRTGYEICQYLKMNPRHKHVRVILTAGVLEPIDEAQTRRVGADGILKKPFEASALIAAVKPLAEAAEKDRGSGAGGQGSGKAAPATPKVLPFVAVVDEEQVRAAVTVAFDAAMDKMVDEITHRVLNALNAKKSSDAAPAPLPAAPLQVEPPRPVAPPPAVPRIGGIRRVSPLRLRSSSILGLNVERSEPEPTSDDAEE